MSAGPETGLFIMLVVSRVDLQIGWQCALPIIIICLLDVLAQVEAGATQRQQATLIEQQTCISRMELKRGIHPLTKLDSQF